MKKNLVIEQCSGCHPELNDRVICQCGKEYEMVHLNLDTVGGQVAVGEQEAEEGDKAYFEHGNSKLQID